MSSELATVVSSLTLESHHFTFELRAAEVSDAQAIADLVGASFPHRLVEATLFGSSRIANYIAAQLVLPGCGREFRYLVAVSGARVVGAIVARVFPGRLHVEYFAVGAAFRGTGIGTALLENAIALGEAAGGKLVSLDVLVDNTRAQAWYRRLGFEKRTGSVWVDCGYPRPGLGGPAFTAGYAQSVVTLDAFGHGMFTVTTSAGQYSVGCLGTRWFRVTDRRAVQDWDLLGVLADLQRTRRLLAVIPTEGHSEEAAECGEVIAQTARMDAEASDVQSKLAGLRRNTSRE